MSNGYERPPKEDCYGRQLQLPVGLHNMTNSKGGLEDRERRPQPSLLFWDKPHGCENQKKSCEGWDNSCLLPVPKKKNDFSLPTAPTVRARTDWQVKVGLYRVG